MNKEYIDGLVNGLEKVIRSKTNNLSAKELKTIKKAKAELIKSTAHQTELTDPQDIANILQVIIIIIELMKSGSS